MAGGEQRVCVLRDLDAACREAGFGVQGQRLGKAVHRSTFRSGVRASTCTQSAAGEVCIPSRPPEARAALVARCKRGKGYVQAPCSSPGQAASCMHLPRGQARCRCRAAVIASNTPLTATALQVDRVGRGRGEGRFASEQAQQYCKSQTCQLFDTPCIWSAVGSRLCWLAKLRLVMHVTDGSCDAHLSRVQMPVATPMRMGRGWAMSNRSRYSTGEGSRGSRSGERLGGEGSYRWREQMQQCLVAKATVQLLTLMRQPPPAPPTAPLPVAAHPLGSSLQAPCHGKQLHSAVSSVVTLLHLLRGGRGGGGGHVGAKLCPWTPLAESLACREGNAAELL